MEKTANPRSTTLKDGEFAGMQSVGNREGGERLWCPRQGSWQWETARRERRNHGSQESTGGSHDLRNNNDREEGRYSSPQRNHHTLPEYPGPKRTAGTSADATRQKEDFDGKYPRIVVSCVGQRGDRRILAPEVGAVTWVNTLLREGLCGVVMEWRGLLGGWDPGH
jgi:hypothetical protein